MVESLMCDEGARVWVSGSGDRLLLTVADAISVGFWTATGDLEEAIQAGTPLQLSVEGGFCRLQVRQNRVFLEFAVGDSGRRACDFPVEDLVAAIASIRTG